MSEPIKRRRYHRWRVCRVRIGPEEFERLEWAADRRAVPLPVLLERVVTTVIKDNLINAVLDDAA